MSQKTAVLYARFSCSKQREESIEGQLRVCRDWCAREGYAIVAEYCDYAISGTTDERPQFQQMIANAGESDIVLVYMMDRFSRDPFDAPIYKRELQKRGVRLVSALEAIPDSPEGIIYEKLLEGLAACESRKTSVRVKRDMTTNAMKCRTNGVRCFGYRTGDDGRYEIDPDEAEIVREVFRRRVHGETVNSIAMDLRRRGVVSRAGNPIKDTFVNHMLHNEKYRGIYSWGGVTKKDGMPRIVSDETFRRAQMVKSKKQRRNEEWGEFALSGRVICSACGRNMRGVSGRGSSNRKYEYYSCGSCKEVRPVRRDWLEERIVEALRELLSQPDEARRIAEMCVGAGEPKEIAEHRKQAAAALRAAETGLSNILKAVEQGIVVPCTKERAEELEAQKERAEHELAMYDRKVFSVESFTRFLQFGATLTDDLLLQGFVYQVMVSDEEVVVTMNFDAEKNEPARLRLSRVRTSFEWCPVCKNTRTMMTVVNGAVYLRFSRAA